MHVNENTVCLYTSEWKLYFGMSKRQEVIDKIHSVVLLTCFVNIRAVLIYRVHIAYSSCG